MSLAGRIAEALEVGGALVVFGYMAVRSQWNHLGIASLPDVSPERYLMELYGIVAGELPAVILFLLAGFFITIAIRGLLVLLRRKPAVDGRLRELEKSSVKAIPYVAVVLLVLAQLSFIVTATGTEARCRRDVILGDVASLVEARCDERRPVAGFYTAAVLCALTVAAVRRWRSDGRPIWRVLLAVLIVILVQLPLIYGVAVKRVTFPGAQLHLDGATAPLTGLVVLQTPNAVELWTVQDGIGRIVIVPSGRIAQMTVGRVRDLFAVARSQASVPPQPLLEAFGLDAPQEKIP